MTGLAHGLVRGLMLLLVQIHYASHWRLKSAPPPLRVAPAPENAHLFVRRMAALIRRPDNGENYSVQARAPDDPIVYVIDDDADVREGVASLLQSVGLKSMIFKSASEFLQKKPSENVSCLILDVRMPGLSGLDFQSELAKAQVSIPIIFITGFGDIPMTVQAMKGGAVEFLTKPIRDQDLLDAIRIALDRDRAQREQRQNEQELRARFEKLSLREQQVMASVCSGLLNKQVAAKIGVSEVTVKVHRHNLMKKRGAQTLPELVRMADTLRIQRKK